jgi:hypothetical protein
MSKDEYEASQAPRGKGSSCRHTGRRAITRVLYLEAETPGEYNTACNQEGYFSIV